MKQFFKSARRLFSSQTDDLDNICRMRTGRIIPVEQPLFLVSQVQRSGGSLMAQLFDGHPECHAHPGELHIGHPKKYNWPNLDLGGTPDQWFDLLFERNLPDYAREGFIKVPRHIRSSYDNSEMRYPFLFLPKLQRKIFRICCERGVSTQRDILNCYMSSYFNAWLDYQGLYSDEHKCITAFTPRLSLHADSVERFFNDYPNGKLVTVIRDPKTWFVSYVNKKPDERGHIAEAMSRWKQSSEAALANRKRWGDRIILITFEGLLQNIEPTMRSLARDLDLTFHECLLTPTFQGMPIRANSTFQVEQHGLLDAPLRRAKDLSAKEVEGINRTVGELYAAVLAEIDTRTAA
jgi:hypothetical protein